jgi:hypothetical protein
VRPRAGVPEASTLALDVTLLERFFGTGPAWSDRAAGRHRFRVDAAGGGWLELFAAPPERLVSLRVADGGVTSLHVDMTLEGVEAVGLREDAERGARWLEIVAGSGRGQTPCTVSITIRPDILVVVGYGRR